MSTKKPVVNEMSPLQILYRFFVGMVFGFANVIPGVSGGTAMVVFGVYERIILLISDLKKRLRTEWKFFLPIIVGMGAAIFLFGSIMHELLETHEGLMQMFFIGVIIFSIPAILKKSFPTLRGTRQDAGCLAAFVVVFALMVWMAIARNNAPAVEEAAAQGSWILVTLKLIGGGVIASATMIIPGISGSLVMVMLGLYGQIMAALHAFNLAQLIPFAIGCVVGIFACAGLIRYLLKNHERLTYSAILGFVVGSIFAVFPGWSYVSPLLAFAVGAAAVVACERFAPKE